MLFYDTETCGYEGPIVLVQYAVDDGPIELYSPWTNTVGDTKKVIEFIINNEVVGFNLAFDHFHLCQMYTTLLLLPENKVLENIITEYAIAEKEARDGPCLKPKSALDLMLHARKGPYQTLMNRDDIRIKRVPTPLVNGLCNELEKRIKFNPIYFAKKKKFHARQWEIFDIKDENEEIIPDFKDIVLKFAPSTALKALAVDALKIPVDNVLLFSNVEVDEAYLPVELGYAPFALAIGSPSDWKGAWPDVIHMHVGHWETNDLARKYARDDVKYTRDLYKYFDCPPLGDDDSILSCMVGACRWRGYNVDINGIKELREEAKKSIGNIPTYYKNVQRWIDPALSPAERLVMGGSTKKVLLKQLTELKIDCDCDEGCEKCSGTKELIHPAADKAKKVLAAREAKYEIDFYSKLIKAGRLHADFNVIGALTSRMSGAGGLNVQGIKKAERVRSKFPLAFSPNKLSGGDFSAFEVVLAIAVWGDQKLADAVTSFRECHKCSGKGCNYCKGKGKVLTKIHALFGTYMYPNWTYEQIVDSDGAEDDRYTKAKSGLFAMMYGGEAYTLATRLGVDVESAERGFIRFTDDYPVVGEARRRIFKMFAALTQTGGLGSKIHWTDPADYVEEPILGHRRYFTLENSIIKALFDLAAKPPKEWADLKIKVHRREREQTVSGAVQSALYGCAFQLQSGNCRAAANHVIQSAGAKITKFVQRKLWDIQPSGVHPFIVQPMNVHDELLTPTDNKYIHLVSDTVKDAVNYFKNKVPLLKIDWHEDIKNWAEKK